MLRTVFRIGSIGLAVLHLMRMFIPSGIDALMAAVALIVLITGIPLMAPGFRKASIIFMVLGIALLALNRRPFADWISSWNSMTNTVAIMVAMQVFAIPVKIGRYDETLNAVARRSFRTPMKLFVFSTVITHVLTSFLMLGSIPVSTSLLGNAVRERIATHQRFLATALTRGYVLAALWAPGAINLYLVGQATGVPWSSLLLPGMAMAAVGLAISCAMERAPGGTVAECVTASPPVSDNGKDAMALPGVKNALLQITVAALSIVAIVFILEKARVGAAYTRIMLAGIAVAGVWTLLLRDPARLREAAKEYWNDRLMKVRDMGPFFVAMGIFSGALEKSGLLDAAAPAISSVSAALGVGAVAVLPLVIIGLAVVGLHPFITIVLFGSILSRTGLPLPPLAIALSLAAGGAAAYMISPFAGIIMSISRYTGASASQVGLGWNWKFSLVFFVFGVLFSLAWGLAFGG